MWLRMSLLVGCVIARERGSLAAQVHDAANDSNSSDSDVVDYPEGAPAAPLLPPDHLLPLDGRHPSPGTMSAEAAAAPHAPTARGALTAALAAAPAAVAALRHGARPPPPRICYSSLAHH